MTCYHPLTALYPAIPDDDGKRRLIFSGFPKYDDSPILRDLLDHEIVKGYRIKLPCGRCIGCRLDYSRMWSIRSMHEARMHNDNCFVTLTFNNEHLPDDRSVHKSYIQSWLKRFRYKFGENIRYLLCGEYGSKRFRPHYHILFFGFRPDDLYVWNVRRGQIYYRSPILESVWHEPHRDDCNGFIVVGDVNFESSAYVSRYITKKVFGADVPKAYQGREPEFQLVSRMPGLGYDFLNKYYSDIFNVGYVLMENGKGDKFKAPIPRYYVDKMKEINEDVYNRYKLDRLDYLYNNLLVDNLDLKAERLHAREELKNMKLDKLVRIYEMDELVHNI